MNKNVNYKEIIFVSLIINFLEWYDYAIFTHSRAAIETNFFETTDVLAGKIKFLLAFVMGYLARPLGGYFFGYLSNIYGRKFSITIASLAMGIPTLSIGLLPGCDLLGVYSTLLLMTFRVFQGFAIGGVMGSAPIFLVESAPKKYRTLFAAIPVAGIYFGWTSGEFLVSITKSLFSETLFYSVGWRLPFLFGVLTTISGWYIKTKFVETPTFLKLQNQNKTRISYIDLISNHKQDILISIFINAPGSFLFYLYAIHLSSDTIINSNYHHYCFIILGLSAILFGYIGSRINLKIYYTFLLVIAFISFYYYQNIDSIPTFIVGLLAAAYIAVEPSVQVQLYPSRVRSVAMGLSYNLAVVVFGGCTPYFMRLLELNYEVVYINYYAYFCFLIGLIGIYYYKNRFEEE